MTDLAAEAREAALWLEDELDGASVEAPHSIEDVRTNDQLVAYAGALFRRIADDYVRCRSPDGDWLDVATALIELTPGNYRRSLKVLSLLLIAYQDDALETLGSPAAAPLPPGGLSETDMDTTNALGRAITSLTNAILALRAGATTTGGLTPAQEQQLEAATQELQQLQTELTAATTQEASDISGVKATEASDVGALTTTVNAAVAELGNLSTTVGGLVTEVGNLANSVALLETEVDELNAAAAAQATDADAANEALNPFAVSPTSGTISVGSTTGIGVSFTNGSGTITVSGLPSDITFDGTGNLTPDGNQAAGNYSLVFSDSENPPQTADFALTVE